MDALRVEARGAFALLLAALLALRLLTPAGFMPAFAHGGVELIACPDGELAAAHHQHPGTPAHHHQPCPYAAAVQPADAAGGHWVAPAIAPAEPALRKGQARAPPPTPRQRLRPPLRAPPVPA